MLPLHDEFVNGTNVGELHVFFKCVDGTNVGILHAYFKFDSFTYSVFAGPEFLQNCMQACVIFI